MKLSHLFEVAYNKFVKANSALEDIYKHLNFKDFNEYDLPGISSGSGDTEIFLEWRGKELYEESIINIMESQGYITPQDFDITMNI